MAGVDFNPLPVAQRCSRPALVGARPEMAEATRMDGSIWPSSWPKAFDFTCSESNMFPSPHVRPLHLRVWGSRRYLPAVR